MPSVAAFSITACSQVLFGNTLVIETLFHTKQKLCRKFNGIGIFILFMRFLGHLFQVG